MLGTSIQYQTLARIAIGCVKASNEMQFYNLVTRIIYKTGEYDMDPGRHTNIYFGLTCDEGIFVGTYSS